MIHDTGEAVAWRLRADQHVLRCVDQMVRDQQHWQIEERPTSTPSLAKLREVQNTQRMAEQHTNLTLAKNKDWDETTVAYGHGTFNSKCHDTTAAETLHERLQSANADQDPHLLPTLSRRGVELRPQTLARFLDDGTAISDAYASLCVPHRACSMPKAIPGVERHAPAPQLEPSRSSSEACASQSVAVDRQHRSAPQRLVPEFKEAIVLHICCAKVEKSKEVTATSVPGVPVGGVEVWHP